MGISKLLATTALTGLLGGMATPAIAQTGPTAPTTPTRTQSGSEPSQSATSDTSPAAAIAEQRPAQNLTDADDSQEVTVTGSRIRAPAGTIAEAVPVTTITAAELLGSRGDVSLGDALNQLPQLRSTFSQANSTASIGTSGLNLLDLRGLGTNRTLTLVNGRRVVTAVPGSYTPDVNTIPSDLVESVDVVTGGNSAIYGSDAVAGVVNFKLRRDFDGVRLKAQGGETTYGDRGTYNVSGLIGHNFDEGRINVTALVQYSHANPLFFADRDYLGAYTGRPGFINSEITNAPNRNFDGIPNTRFVNGGITFGSLSTGGYTALSCPLPNATNAAQRAVVCAPGLTPTGGTIPYQFAFQPDGSLVRDDPAHGLTDLRTIGAGVLGGLSATGVEDAMLQPGYDNVIGNLLVHADLSDAFKPFVEATLARVISTQQSTQPTFISSTLAPGFSINNGFLSPQARAVLVSALAPGATTFNIQRFNNDIGTRAENHSRLTYRAVFGVEGDISHVGNLHYEVAANYGRTENFYRSGGNVLVANYNKATNAVLAPATYAGSNYVLNASGAKVVCAVNANANTADDDAGCFPLNVFGYGVGDPRAVNYVKYTSSRSQWAQEVDGTAFLSGDSTGLFNLPGGPAGFVIGGEYRKEEAYSAYDPVTRSGATFLNAAAIFAPPAVEIKEAFGELRLPLLKNLPLVRELTANGAGRISDYGGATGSVTAWDAGLVWSPVRDVHVRATMDRSVRAPNLTNLYATSAVTFANGLNDPCDQPGSASTNVSDNIAAGPNRAKNCAAAGIPTTLTYVNGSGQTVSVPWYNQSPSGTQGSNSGNPNLVPEIGYDFSVGAVFEPHWVPGLSFGATYYNIRVKNVISGLTGQAIIDRCYDDPGSINNPFCASVFRRTGTGSSVTDFTFNGQTGRLLQSTPNATFALAGNGLAFVNQPFNFAKLSTRGIDIEGSYRRQFTPDISATFHLTAGYVMDRLSYSYIADPTRFDRIDGTLGDPSWQGAFNVQFKVGQFDLSYNERYVGKQIVSGLSYETFYASQGRAPLNPDARPFLYYDPIVYHNIRVGMNVTEKFHIYVGADNVTNELPPYDLTGTQNFTSGSTDSIYPNTGRFLYAGVEARF